MLDTKIAGEMFNRSLGEAEDGIESIVYLANAPELEGLSGKFFGGKKKFALFLRLMTKKHVINFGN